MATRFVHTCFDNACKSGLYLLTSTITSVEINIGVLCPFVGKQNQIPALIFYIDEQSVKSVTSHAGNTKSVTILDPLCQNNSQVNLWIMSFILVCTFFYKTNHLKYSQIFLDQ